jgi:hypothetical protein
MRALILRHGRVNRRVLLGFSPLALIWLAMSLRGETAVLLIGTLLGLILSAVVMLTHEAMDPNLERFILSLPVSRVQLVWETYVAGLLALILGQVLPFLLNGLGRRLVPAYTVPVTPAAVGVAVMIFFVLACLTFFLLPFRFTLGGQKGLMSFSISVVIILASLIAWKGMNGLMHAIDTMGGLILDHPAFGLLGILGVMAFGGLSLAISIRTYGRLG